MMDFPLTVRHIFEHGRTLYADSEVVTSEADGPRRIEFGALADRARRQIVQGAVEDPYLDAHGGLAA